MSSISIERLNSLFLRELAVIINRENKSDVVNYYNLTEVRITRDLSFATVFYTILNDDPEVIKVAQANLDKINKQVRKELASKVNNLRKMPELVFKYDEALAYGNKIDKILKSIE
ncbi:30S ribosome-binding factor RbfA [Paracholeplasma manati]|jgi:ribosome-binding factor A|uniref:Ribosome-binding factor A n=1 Tax=Paracholeplasma manati TaxID=591373 RepID=A0ABT2Y7E8_9MOLU|nr:30S ribosome-binding factor RbfA [Paracholeplasma manati]MCV2232412.1 30S ribosome-binding factor RbfA [Paracholeplasma manati]MDG0888002.1 30S ribosome-binding factor RbfA [Paracholeplasma manati]MDX9807648.1 30S ribosome-binding factor RbfA [Acholeplasma sp.]